MMIIKTHKELKIQSKIWKKEWDSILTPEAMDFFITLVEKFSSERNRLLSERKENQNKVDSGIKLDFLKETEATRQGNWKVSQIPQDLQDRRVEITGPVDRKMIINGLNSRAKVYMADFEDSQSPYFNDMLDGQVNLYDAVRRKIKFKNPDGKEYHLNNNPAVLIVRPRGLHLNEKHVTYKGSLVSGSLFDFAFYVFHNAQEALSRGTGPYFYIPKLENHYEARFWANIFHETEKYLDLTDGTIKATVLIETITAVFEMDEIIYELRNYIAGLNCGRWDYIFSFIKKFHKFPEFVLPNRDQVGMGVHFLKSYSLLLIKTCHRRGIHAMGGMAAQIPIKSNETLNKIAFEKVRIDKEREVENGHDGTWVAHPGLVPVAMEIFNRLMPNSNQINKQLDVNITAEDLLKVPEGNITMEGFIGNMKASLHYTAAWVSGNGCVPYNHLMEDLATAEISRSQLWQWIHHNCKLDDGTEINTSLYHKVMDDAMKECESFGSLLVAPLSGYHLAKKILEQVILDKDFITFLSLPSYEHLD